MLFCRLHTGASVAALQMLRDALCKGIPGELTRMWVNATDERKWHRGAVQALMKASLFVMPDVDACIAKVPQSHGPYLIILSVQGDVKALTMPLSPHGEVNMILKPCCQQHAPFNTLPA